MQDVAQPNRKPTCEGIRQTEVTGNRTRTKSKNAVPPSHAGKMQEMQGQEDMCMRTRSKTAQYRSRDFIYLISAQNSHIIRESGLIHHSHHHTRTMARQYQDAIPRWRFSRVPAPLRRWRGLWLPAAWLLARLRRASRHRCCCLIRGYLDFACLRL